MSADLVKAPVAIENGMIQVNSLDTAYRYAKYVFESGLAPNGFKNVEAILIAMQMGAELGLKPMQSIQNIAVINGKPGIYGKAMPGIVMQTGALDKFEEWWEGEGETLVACCKVKRKGVAEERVEKFSVVDAKQAGLWGKKTRDGGPTPWTQYPKDMLRYRARSRAFVLFSDILCGLYAVEELRDVPSDAPPEVTLGTASAEDPLLKQAVGTVIETQTEAPPVVVKAKIETPSASAESESNRAFLESEQKKNDAALTEKQKEMAAKGDTGGKKKTKPPAKSDEPAPTVDGEPTFKCIACKDTGKNTRNAPCPCCQKPDKASGEGFKTEASNADDGPAEGDISFDAPETPIVDEKLAKLEQIYKDSIGKDLKEIRKLVNPAWHILSKDQKKSVFRAAQIQNETELANLNEMQLRKFLETIRDTYKADLK